PLLDEAAELLGELDPAAGRGLAQQEHDRARDLANAKQTLVNMQAAGVDPLMSAEELAEQNQEQETRQTAAERATSDRTWAFGHIVVDEAQELSPMQWRLLVRRCPLKSFTIVGDIAQTSSVAGANSWQGALAPMFGDRWQLEELTVNYRTPSQIAEAAVRMANAAGLVVSAPKAVREGRWSPVIDEVDPGQVVSRLVEVLPEELDALDGGLLAVIADGHFLPEATAALRAAHGRRVGTGAGSYE
ncbi:AAA family ATPase, partial [Pseudarthrobacter scleromae]